MSSPPLDNTHGRQRRAWHDITALGLHARSDDVGRGMTSPRLDSTHGRQHRAWHDITALGHHTRSKTSGMECHHLLWTAHTVSNVRRGMMSSPPLDRTHSRQHRAWHDITALGLHTQSATSGVACHHRLWRAQMIERCQALLAIIAFGQHTRSDDVRRYMPSPPLE